MVGANIVLCARTPRAQQGSCQIL